MIVRKQDITGDAEGAPVQKVLAQTPSSSSGSNAEPNAAQAALLKRVEELKRQGGVA